MKISDSGKISLVYSTFIAFAFLTSGCRVQTKNIGANDPEYDTIVNINLFKDAPGKYEIKENKDVVSIPFEYYGGNKILIHGYINGKKVKLLIDNGKLWDQVWFYNGEVDSLNLKYKNSNQQKVEGLGEDGASAIIDGTVVDVKFGDITFRDQPSLISTPDAGFQSMFPGVNGQVSALFFKHFIVKFDFENSVILLTKPDKFKFSGKGQAIAMLKRDNGSYCIPFTLQIADKSIENCLIDIDLGTVFPLHLFENKQMNIILPLHAEKHILGYGASGKIVGYSDKINKVTIGNYSFDNVPTEFVEESKNSSIIETGTFGIPLMEKFNITFDYFNLKMYIEPNKNFTLPFKYEY
jgi:hypothetical protein